LLVVPSGALTQLPFHVLLTETPANDKSIAWLVRGHALRVAGSILAEGAAARRKTKRRDKANDWFW
jgi:hypothetical protein